MPHYQHHNKCYCDNDNKTKQEAVKILVENVHTCVDTSISKKNPQKRNL